METSEKKDIKTEIAAIFRPVASKKPTSVALTPAEVILLPLSLHYYHANYHRYYLLASSLSQSLSLVGYHYDYYHNHYNQSGTKLEI
jgi:hypothetical protein